jgi:hypothetical protein
MTIIEYELVPIDNHQKVIPLWVKDGGYFYDSETEKMIGIANDDYLPNYIRVLTEQELIDIVLAQHEKTPYYKIPSTDIMTTSEVTKIVTDWLESKTEE